MEIVFLVRCPSNTFSRGSWLQRGGNRLKGKPLFHEVDFTIKKYIFINTSMNLNL